MCLLFVFVFRLTFLSRTVPVGLGKLVKLLRLELANNREFQTTFLLLFLHHFLSLICQETYSILLYLPPFFIFQTFKFSYCCFCISKLLYLDCQILLSTEVVTRLSHDQVALFKTFRGSAQNCARQTINHAASRIKQAQLQLCG